MKALLIKLIAGCVLGLVIGHHLWYEPNPGNLQWAVSQNDGSSEFVQPTALSTERALVSWSGQSCDSAGHYQQSPDANSLQSISWMPTATSPVESQELIATLSSRANSSGPATMRLSVQTSGWLPPEELLELAVSTAGQTSVSWSMQYEATSYAPPLLSSEEPPRESQLLANAVL